MQNNLFQLNPEQIKAVKATEGAFLVLAGAGSGKTRVVTMRIVHLINEGISPSKILGVTFTNKAAEEMRSRVNQLTQSQVMISTFHSLGAKILRESIGAIGYSPHFTIYDEEDVEKLLHNCLIELEISTKKSDVKPFRQMISQAKNALKAPEQITSFDLDSKIEDNFVKVYTLYQNKLKEYQAVDFDDLLYLPVKIWQEHPHVLERYRERWSFVLIDEYQDTNAAQYLMAKLLVEKSGNIFVVGDPDQSIYSWRGAHIGNILNFERDYPGSTVIRLEQNYRSHSNILNLANELISYNTDRYEKELWSDLGEGEKVKLFVGEDDREEADFVATQVTYHKIEHDVPLRNMVIFYRTNAQSRVFEDSLLHRSIPYVIIGGISFYQRREIKDILAFLRMAHSGSDYMAFLRTINLPKRGFGDAAVEKIRHGANLERLTLLAYCDALVKNQPLENVCKLTAKQKESLKEYVDIIHDLHRMSKQESIKNLVKAAIEQTNYMDFLLEDKETYLDRRENLDQLITKAIEWETSAQLPTLEAFLEELCLKSNMDEVDQNQDRLNLMTIHNGKGLEFEVTFLVGLEEDLFPHINSEKDPKAIEEERRLCYVGVTRAKKYLYISYCRLRYLWGNLRRQEPSRFLKEMPKKYIEKFVPGVRVKRTMPIPNKNVMPKPSFKSIQPVPPVAMEIFTPGDFIFHKDFGIGQIKESYEGSMGLTYKVHFNKDNHQRTLIAKYAVLSKLND
jgi:DNA helicase-2/ATP-dependent DNA helicase PcrA